MTMAEDWQDGLRGWLGAFLSHLGHKAQRQMCPLYVAGLIGPGERKSVQPMASRTPAADYDQRSAASQIVRQAGHYGLHLVQTALTGFNCGGGLFDELQCLDYGAGWKTARPKHFKSTPRGD
jgi:hypothetical protein